MAALRCIRTKDSSSSGGSTVWQQQQQQQQHQQGAMLMHPGNHSQAQQMTCHCQIRYVHPWQKNRQEI